MRLSLKRLVSHLPQLSVNRGVRAHSNVSTVRSPVAQIDHANADIARLLAFEPRTAPLSRCQREFFLSSQSTWDAKSAEMLSADLEQAGVSSFRPDPIYASLSFRPGYHASPHIEDGAFLPWRSGTLSGAADLNQVIRENIDGPDHMYWAVYLGHRFLVDHRVASIVSEFVDHPMMPMVMTTTRAPTVVRYTAPVAALVDRLPWRDRRVVDMGCAEGLLSLIALEHGARSVLAIDLNAANAAHLRKNAELNGLDPEQAEFLAGNVEHEAIRTRVADFSPDTMLANLGPHYGQADLASIDVAGNTPSITRLILGGYADVSGRFSPSAAMDHARRYGFEYELHYLNIAGRNAFVSVLMTRAE